MDRIKKRWEIQKNWQLLFPFLGVALTVYTAYKVSRTLLHSLGLNNTYIEWVFTIGITAVIFYVLLRFFLWCFEKLKNKWVVTYRWEMIAIFIVFAFTGSSSVKIGRPILQIIGVTKDNLNPILYWTLFVVLSLVFYQILLVCFGWLFGQFKFFWNFEKKMLKRMGLGFLLN